MADENFFRLLKDLSPIFNPPPHSQTKLILFVAKIWRKFSRSDSNRTKLKKKKKLRQNYKVQVESMNEVILLCGQPALKKKKKVFLVKKRKLSCRLRDSFTLLPATFPSEIDATSFMVIFKRLHF